MDPCCGVVPSWKKRAVCCLVRAVRSVIGMIVVAGIAAMLIRSYQLSKFNSKCEHLRAELERLRRMQGAPSRSVSQTDLENPCDTGHKQNECALPEKEVRDAIRRELSLYYADKTGMPDFAMENLGGCVLTTRNTKNFCPESSSFLQIFSNAESTPDRILRPDVTPGNCWAFQGHQGTVVIKLMSFVFITHVTLEHISPKMAPSGDISSAPKTFTLWGLKDADDPFGKHKFGTFEYKKGSRPVQTFPVQHPVQKPFRVVEVIFHDNQGNGQYTCVYRVRIHGKMDRSEGKSSGNPPL